MKKLTKIAIFCFICLNFVPNVLAKSDITNISFNNVSLSNRLLSPFEIKKFENDSILCTGNFGEILKQLFSLIKIIVPILIIGLGVVDFIKALSSQKPEELKNATSKLVKRLIIGAIIFVLPTIIDFILNIAGITSSTCGW